MFKKTLITATILLSSTAMAAGITIKSEDSIPATKLPVVFNIKNSSGVDFRTVAKDLEQTGKIKAYFGSCSSIEKNIHRQVACVTTSGYSVEVKVPRTGGGRIFTTPLVNDSPLPIADSIFKSALNTKASPFLVEIAYVSKNKRTGIYKLAVANYNGTNARVLLTSPQPILSPSWSHDGKYITYVSYETVRGSIFVHDIHSNRRVKVFEQRGLNAYPSFGTTDDELLLSVSGENENSHIYTLNILSKRLARTKNVRKNINAIYPRKIQNNEFVFVTLDGKDVPYLMVRDSKGNSRYVKRYPLNAPSTDKNGDIVAINGASLVRMDFNGKTWGNNKTISTDRSIESPSISNNGVSIFYVFEKNGKNLIANSLISDEKLITISSPTENIIQVSAF